MQRDGRGPVGKAESSARQTESGTQPEPGKRTLTEQLGSAPPRSPPLFDGDPQWDTIEELEAQLGDGEAVDPRVAAHVSRATGQDVSGARVHRGPVAAAMADKRRATAFAVGKHIVMSASAPAPGTPAGDALLAHELAHTAQQGAAAADSAARKKPIGEEDQAAERDAGMARLGNFAGAIGDVMRTGLQLQRCSEIKPAKVTELRGKEAEAKLAELGGRLATDPDYSGGRKAIAGSHIQYQLLSTPSPTRQVGIYQWTHDGPEGYHAQSIPAAGRPDMIPSAAPGPGGMFVNAHNVGATTMPLPKPGTYTTDAWVRAGVDNHGVLEGYELHVPHTVEVVPLTSARQEAYGKLANDGKEDDYQKFRDTMTCRWCCSSLAVRTRRGRATSTRSRRRRRTRPRHSPEHWHSRQRTRAPTNRGRSRITGTSRCRPRTSRRRTSAATASSRWAHAAATTSA